MPAMVEYSLVVTSSQPPDSPQPGGASMKWVAVR